MSSDTPFEKVLWVQGLILERAKGFEPSTPTLARLCSTPELHPLFALYVRAGYMPESSARCKA